MSNGQESEPPTALVLAPKFVVSPTDIKVRIAELQDFVQSYMIEGEDFGTIPGTAKPTLYKSGAEKLCDVYGFQRLFQTMNRVEDWEKGFFHYEIRADLVDSRTGLTVAQGLGSANTMEARYRWRKEERKCPECDQPTIIKGKEEYGGGWVCWKKRGGCGQNFAEFDLSITNQAVGRIENDDPYTLVNTILKMAKKRALVDAVLSATRSSGLFTQDMEDTASGVIEGEVIREPIDESPEGGPYDPPPAASPAKTEGRRRRPAAKSKATLEAEAKAIQAGSPPANDVTRWHCASCKDKRPIGADVKDCPYCGHRRGAKTEEKAPPTSSEEAKGDGDPAVLTEEEMKAERDAQGSASEGQAAEEAEAVAERERTEAEAQAVGDEGPFE